MEKAQVELKRLQTLCPDKKFHLYRIKGRLTPSDAAGKIKELQDRIKELEANAPRPDNPST